MNGFAGLFCLILYLMSFIQIIKVFFIKCWYAVDDVLHRASINCYALPYSQFSVICHSSRFAEIFGETALYKVVFGEVIILLFGGIGLFIEKQTDFVQFIIVDI